MSGGHVVFTAGTMRLAVGAGAALATMQVGAIAPLPGAPGPVLGLVGFRGQVLALVDAARLAGEPGLSGIPRHAVVLAEEGIALAADSLPDVAEAGERARLPQGMAAGLGDWVAEVLLGPAGDATIVVDPARLSAAVSGAVK